MRKNNQDNQVRKFCNYFVHLLTALTFRMNTRENFAEPSWFFQVVWREKMKLNHLFWLFYIQVGLREIPHGKIKYTKTESKQKYAHHQNFKEWMGKRSHIFFIKNNISQLKIVKIVELCEFRQQRRYFQSNFYAERACVEITS